MALMETKGAQIVIETLIEQGVDIVFGYPGGTVLDLYDELYNNDKRLKHILMCHEQHAAHAADGYARATGKTGVVIATSGPGATNLVTGIANAYLDSVPIVALTGNIPMGMIGSDSFQEVDTTGITMPITKHNFIVKNIAELADTIREAFLIARTGRPGPVLVDIPKNIQIEMCEYEKKEPVSPQSFLLPADELIDEAVKLINECKQPFIYAGGGVVISEASRQLIEFADKIDSPVGTTIMGLTAVPWHYDKFTGMMGMHGDYTASWAVNEADLIIALGTRFSDRVIGSKEEFGKNAKIIHVDIDEAEINKNIWSYISLPGNIKCVLAELNDRVSKKMRPKWNRRVSEIKAAHSIKAVPDDTVLRPWNVLRKIWEHAEGKAIVATDVGQHQMWTAQYYRFSEPRTFLTSGGLGAMGFGMGAAIGGCMGTGNKTVMITGDGSFHMNMPELATAVTHKLPIIVVVMNNHALGMVKQLQTYFQGERFSSTLLERKTDYVKLAEAFGAKGLRIESPAMMDSVLAEAFAQDGPVVIDCPIDRDEMVLPMIPPGGSIKNIIM